MEQAMDSKNTYVLADKYFIVTPVFKKEEEENFGQFKSLGEKIVGMIEGELKKPKNTEN